MTSPDAFSAIADPHRRTILEQLRRGPRSVNEIASTLPVSRPAVSQHLKVLLDAGLVDASAAGTKRLYAIKSQGLLKPGLWLDQFWEE